MLTILKRMNDNGILAYAKSIPEDWTYEIPVSQLKIDTLNINAYLYYCKKKKWECTLDKAYIMHDATTSNENFSYCNGKLTCSNISDTIYNVCNIIRGHEGNVVLLMIMIVRQ